MYDPVIGRWVVPDPYNEFWSPYLAMGNNPVSFSDADGGCVGCSIDKSEYYIDAGSTATGGYSTVDNFGNAWSVDLNGNASMQFPSFTVNYELAGNSNRASSGGGDVNKLASVSDPWWYEPFDITTNLTFVGIDLFAKNYGIKKVPGLGPIGWTMSTSKNIHQLQRYYIKRDQNIAIAEVYSDFGFSSIITFGKVGVPGVLGGIGYSILKSDPYQNAAINGFPTGYMGAQDSRLFETLYFKD